VRRIAKELKKAKQCGVYEPELSRFWPKNGNTREAEIALFAELHGLRLRYYKEGFCAIFDKDPYR
jgi:hypothetical protein